MGQDQTADVDILIVGAGVTGIYQLWLAREAGYSVQMLEQGTAAAVSLAPRQDISMADQLDVAHPLNSHHADERTVGHATPESHSCRELLIKLVRRHVGLLPAVRRDHVPVGLGCAVDDLKDPRAFQIMTRAN